MCNIMTAYQNKTPLIITAGQQTREMILCEPFLTNHDETMLPRPWVKWSYQPVRAQDVPGAIMRAYAIALQPPSGPIYISIPLDDWDQPALGDAAVRTVSTRYAPDPDRISMFAERIRKSKNPALVYGQEIDRSGGWDAGIKFAEQLRAPVFFAPLAEGLLSPRRIRNSRECCRWRSARSASGFAVTISSSSSARRFSVITHTLAATTSRRDPSYCKSPPILRTLARLRLATVFWLTQNWRSNL
jgi:thiamine pyrophosphate-dependent acetolactate synthase large subunit-like protein